MIRVVVVVIIVKVTLEQELICVSDVQTLSELPLNRLLLVKKTFEIEQVKRNDENKENVSAPKALPLKAKQNINRGSYGPPTYGVQHEDSNSKKSGGKKSIQSIFQISVTTLAFLAFGGYLLCLIVQAIKGKHNNYNMMDTNQLMAYIARPTRRPVRRRPPIRRKRPTRRRRKPAKRPSRNRKTNKKGKFGSVRTKREAWPNVDSENMYQTLTILAESYVHYHTTDYKNYNYTVRDY